jgi:hypothetical protein
LVTDQEDVADEVFGKVLPMMARGGDAADGSNPDDKMRQPLNSTWEAGTRAGHQYAP